MASDRPRRLVLPSVLAVTLIGGASALLSCGDGEKNVVVDALPGQLPDDGAVVIDARPVDGETPVDGLVADTAVPDAASPDASPDAALPIDASIDAAPPIDAPPDAEVG